jgi:hypothetical protein
MRKCPIHSDIAPPVMWYEIHLLCEVCTKEYKIVPIYGKSYSTGPFMIAKRDKNEEKNMYEEKN